MQTSDALDKIAPAIVQAQSELKHAVKASDNDGFKRAGKATKYADLSAVWDAAKPVLTKNKLAALQDVVTTEGGLGVRTRLLHESGQWIEFDPPIIPLEKRNAHGAGSVLTYGRRYSLSAALGVVADEDDDGNAASASNGNGVADAQSITDPSKEKNPAGRSKAVTTVREMCREVNACSDASELVALINTDDFKKAAFRTCKDFPKDWIGPEDNSGLSGIVAQMGVTLKCPDDCSTWVMRVEAAVRKSRQPLAAE